MYATDGAALETARLALDQGFDRWPHAHAACFFYLPFEHSEALEDQERAVAAFAALDEDGYLDYALAHRDVIARFGRFPHRNAILGRESTTEEIAFLKQPGSSF